MIQVAPIRSERLTLVSLSPGFFQASLDGRLAEAARLLGATLPPEWPGSWRPLLRVRLTDLRVDPLARPWLLRAIVLREPERRMVGHVGFHGPPVDGAAEIGYAVEPADRRQGYATEAATALLAWAEAEHGIRRFRASVSPDNAPSLGLARKLGFVRTGTRWDEEDGEELVFELDRSG